MPFELLSVMLHQQTSDIAQLMLPETYWSS
jgi:hypothetical protein